MTPDLVDRQGFWLVGVTQTGKSVADIDICGLWDAYQELEAQIPGRIDGAWYELHVGAEAGNGIYTVMAGAEIESVKETDTRVRNFGLQLYDRDFNPNDPENSILHIYIPLEE